MENEEKRFEELLFRFYEGVLSEPEEEELFALFSKSYIANDEKYARDRALLNAFIALREHGKNLRRQERILNFIDESLLKRRRIRLICFQIGGMAVAACIVLFFFLRSPMSDKGGIEAEKVLVDLPNAGKSSAKISSEAEIKVLSNKGKRTLPLRKRKSLQGKVEPMEEENCEIQEIEVPVYDNRVSKSLAECMQEQIAEEIKEELLQEVEEPIRIECDRLIKYDNRRLIRFESGDKDAERLYPLSLSLGRTFLSERKK